MGVRTPSDETPYEPPPIGPSPLSAVLLGLVLLVVLVSNGRPIGSADARPTERVAATLAQHGRLDLDDYPDVEEPFARTVGSHRVSIYPVASAVLATPLFAVARVFFALDEIGLALAGKWAASVFSAAAAALLYLAVGWRGRPHHDGLWTAVVFALGTSVWSTSQALWQHPAALLGLCGALVCLVRAEHDERWAGRAGLFLTAAVAARYADAVLVAALATGIAVRWPRRIPHLVLWASPIVAAVLAYHWMYFGSPLRQGLPVGGRFAAPWGEGHVGLLVSPGKGLLVFTPVAAMAAVGLVRAARAGEQWLAVTCASAFAAHWLFIGRWSAWDGGECFGPRMMTDALPVLFLFLPDAHDAAPGLTAALAALSVAVQALGAFAYDYRWERLRQRPVASVHPELWDVAHSPVAFYAERRLVILAAPRIREGKAEIREYPIVVAGGRGSRVAFGADRLRVEGADETMSDVHEERGARVTDGRLRLRGRWDGLFLRVTEEARPRTLELRVAGEGTGTLYVGERGFWTESVKWTSYAMAGRFRFRHPYAYATSGGPDVVITLGRAAGTADLAAVRLVPPSEPDDVLRLP